jgi:ribonuclease-3
MPNSEANVPLDPDMRKLCEDLGYRFSDLALLRDALTHKSLANERPAIAPRDNERLEFLGDAVLGLVTASMLADEFPDADEGELTRRRADLVSEAGLVEIAQRIHLGEALRLGKGEERSGGREKPRLLSSALEACIGAIYRDGGIDAAYDVVGRLFAHRLADEAPGLKDFKSRAQEWAQAHLRATPVYRTLRTEGPDHRRSFVVAMEIDGIEVSKGEGSSKNEAEQIAAMLALEEWGTDSVSETS